MLVSLKPFPLMELKAENNDCEDGNASKFHHDLWPLEELNPKKARFPCCIVWTPFPVVSWLAPYMGHIGICREDGTILDFAGSNFVNVDDFAYGAVARYLQLDRKQCCFPAYPSRHACLQPHRHAEIGTAVSWDDALAACARTYQHKNYNLFTCNCHSFVFSCLNRLACDGYVRWNLLNLAALILWKGRWVDRMSAVRSFCPSAAVIFVGVVVAGWPFLVGMAAFTLLLVAWFVVGTYCVEGLLD